MEYPLKNDLSIYPVFFKKERVYSRPFAKKSLFRIIEQMLCLYIFCIFSAFTLPLSCVETQPPSSSFQKTLPKNSLSQRFVQATPGQYIVSSYGKSYNLLFIRSLSGSTLNLEELTLPSSGVDLKTFNWQTWLNQGAEGSTSWTIYQIDLHTAELLGCYSHTKKRWMGLEDSEQFLTKLLFLTFERVPPHERKKIGHPPPPGESDTRAVWNPPLVILGKKISKPKFEVWRATWPKDGSLLSSCRIELFFNQETPTFPFPHWIEVQSTHYTFKQHIVDSGFSLTSPITLPARPKA